MLSQATFLVLCSLEGRGKEREKKGGTRYSNTFTTYLWATKPRSRHKAPVPGLPHTGRSPPPSFAATSPLLKCAAKSSAIAFPISAIHTHTPCRGGKINPKFFFKNQGSSNQSHFHNKLKADTNHHR